MVGQCRYFVIGLHALAALLHHYWWKDNTLLRMMPRKRFVILFHFLTPSRDGVFTFTANRI